MTTNKNFNLVHITDIHLNFCDTNTILGFCNKILRKKPDAIVLSGDISEAAALVDHLGILGVMLKKTCPIFFILGNHDYYHGSIRETRRDITKLFTYSEQMKNDKAPRLAYLGSSGIVPLTTNTALVGADGWYDGQYADWFNSRVMMSDYELISDFRVLTTQNIFRKINELAQESAKYVKTNVEKAFVNFDHVFVATHVPPFRESSTFRGKISDNNWMPHFSSKAMGDVLKDLAKSNPSKNITVLCGHTHGYSDVQITPNLRVVTGDAEYRSPKVGDVFVFQSS